MSRICTIDVGSTRIKAAIRDRESKILLRREKAFPKLVTNATFDEYQILWKEIIELINEISIECEFDKLIMSCQMAGFSAIDESGNPQAPMLLGVDPRVPLGPDMDLNISGVPKGGPSTFAIYKWLFKEFNYLSNPTVRIGGIKEYLLFRMTGQWCTDRASASSFGFYDIYARKWSRDSLAASGLSENQLPRIMEIDSFIGYATEELQRAIASDTSVQIYCGLGDGPAANISVGAIGEGRACLSKGTTVVVRILVSQLRDDLHDYPYFVQHVKDDWYCIGLRFTFDSSLNKFLSAGQHRREMVESELISYLDEFLKRLKVEEIRAVGGREINFPPHWQICELGDEYQDGTKALALILQSGSLREIRKIIDDEVGLRLEIK